MDLRSHRVLPWSLRALWAAQALAAGPAFAAALDGRSQPVRTTASVLLWALWAAALLGTALLAPVTLTVVRLIAPAGAGAAVWAASTGAPSSLAMVVALASTLGALAAAFAPGTGRAFVNGPAYGDERRHLLRLPAPLLVAVVPLTWVVTAGAVVAAPLLLAAQVWIAGGLVAVAGLPAAVVGARSLHALTLRWLVFVPAGVVLKDQLALVDPVLFQRRTIEALRPAPADTDSLDLTGGASGLALELLLHEKVEMTLVKPKERLGETGRSARLLFTPTRPGQVLADAKAARLPVG
jgi:hypothetical protein